MKTRTGQVFRARGWTVAIGAVLCIALAVIFAANAGPFDLPAVIEINGETVRLSEMGLGSIHGVLAIGGVAVAAIAAATALLIVLPMAVLLPLLLVALVVCGVLIVALVAITGAAAFVFSPLIVIVGVMWLCARLLRGGRSRNPAASDAQANQSTAPGATIGR